MKKIVLLIALTFPASTAFAAGHGDAAAGADVFKKCQSCHVVRAPDGEVLAGRSAKSGPNLYGMIGMTAGTVEGFRYKKSIIAAGEAGLVWTPELIEAYVQNPTAFLKEFLGENGARSGMSFRLRKEDDAANIAAFLATFSQ